MATPSDLGLNKYYHSSAVTARISCQHMEALGKQLDSCNYSNGGSMSDKDVIRDMQNMWEKKKRILEYINSQAGKVDLISTAEIAAQLKLPEDFVIKTLEGFNIQLEDEEDM